MSRSASNQAVVRQKFSEELEKFLWRSLVDGAIDRNDRAGLLDYSMRPYVATCEEPLPILLPAPPAESAS